jgi:hypothetical protein
MEGLLVFRGGIPTKGYPGAGILGRYSLGGVELKDAVR